MFPVHRAIHVNSITYLSQEHIKDKNNEKISGIIDPTIEYPSISSDSGMSSRNC
jgi:hypothetical protein